MFLRNAWYVVARPAEVGRALLGRTVCGTPLVLYRTQAGAPVALQDHCPHRRYALSRGRLEGDEVRCMYHGLRFDRVGACTHIPGQDHIPANLTARAFPLAERHGWIWIWTGTAEAADEAQIPDCGLNERPGWEAVFGYLHIASDYKLLLDNFLDLTHVAFVHQSTLGSPQVADAPMKVERDESGVRFVRRIANVPVPPTFRKAREFAGNIDRWQKGTYRPPVHFFNDVRAVPTGTDDESRGFRWVVINTVTPETEEGTHYFWSVARNFALGDDGVGEQLRQEIVKAFDEDREVIELQQRMIAMERPPQPLRNLACDEANQAMRNLLRRLIKAEVVAEA